MIFRVLLLFSIITIGAVGAMGICFILSELIHNWKDDDDGKG